MSLNPVESFPRCDVRKLILTHFVQFVGNEVLTEPQERLHFGLWAIAKSPLVIGADLNTIPESSLNILKNKVNAPIKYY